MPTNGGKSSNQTQQLEENIEALTNDLEEVQVEQFRKMPRLSQRPENEQDFTSDNIVEALVTNHENVFLKEFNQLNNQSKEWLCKSK